LHYESLEFKRISNNWMNGIQEVSGSIPLSSTWKGSLFWWAFL